MVKVNTKTYRIIAFILILVFCASFPATIVSAEGSQYITNYVTGITAGSNGKINVNFQITGVGAMDQIGAIEIYIYENGTTVKTFYSSSTSGMMGSNTVIHSSSVTYNGTVGKSYSAYVVYQAGKNGDWDNTGVLTSSVTAKN